MMDRGLFTNSRMCHPTAWSVIEHAGGVIFQILSSLLNEHVSQIDYMIDHIVRAAKCPVISHLYGSRRRPTLSR